MEYNKIIAVTGLPGLYELLSSKTDGAIVRSLDDKSTRFVSSRVHNFSHLESIEIYTVRENVNLVDILKAMEASGEKLPEDKDNAALKAYFSKVYPDMDFDRVYSSDLKKMVKWYTVLKSNDIEIKLSEPEEEEEIVVEEEIVEKAAPKKKAVPVSKEAEAPEAKKPAKEAGKAVTAKAAPKQKEAAEEKPKAKKPAAKAAAESKETGKKKAAEEKPKKAAKKKS
jgi:hypothetical protein